MNKFKRLIACLLLVLLAAALCSCDFLDQMKAHHAVWNNAAKTEILWNGEVYRQLMKIETDSLYSTNVRVTDADVPVLLSDAYGNTAHVDSTGNQIFFDYYIYDEAYSMRRFVRSAVYDQYEAAAKNPQMNRFCAEISIYTHENGETALTTSIRFPIWTSRRSTTFYAISTRRRAL